jgi:hypothetical protein
MAKATGLGWTTMNVTKSDGSTIVDIRNDCQNLDFATPRAVIDVTGIDKFAHERLLGLGDFTLNLSGTFNATVSHLVFRDPSSGTVNRATSIVVNGATLNNNCVITDYPVTRGTDGALTWKVPLSLADGALPTWS